MNLFPCLAWDDCLSESVLQNLPVSSIEYFLCCCCNHMPKTHQWWSGFISDLWILVHCYIELYIIYNELSGVGGDSEDAVPLWCWRHVTQLPFFGQWFLLQNQAGLSEDPSAAETMVATWDMSLAPLIPFGPAPHSLIASQAVVCSLLWSGKGRWVAWITTELICWTKCWQASRTVLRSLWPLPKTHQV